MTDGMQKSFRRPSSGAAPFEVDELFFSRTDERGVILSGNTVFQRVADYPWDELLGAPHKIIRHSDMPRAVFFLLWQTIQQGNPIGAFVKNRSRDGLYYWVFAIVTPVQGGYLSVRMKPTSDLRALVEKEYANLHSAEVAEDLEPSESAQILMARLNELGFKTYQAFMAKALSNEVISRCERLGKEPDARLAHFDEIHQAISDVASETADLSNVFETIRGIPYNMRILASRLESAGGPISVISANYGVLSEEIAGWMRNFVENTSGAFGEINSAVEEGQFLHCTSLIQEEMTRQFLSERGLDSHIEVTKETEVLHGQTQSLQAKALAGIQRVAIQADRFSQSIRDMKRLITGLGATRMMCKIEGARLKGEGEGLSGVISQLDQFQENIESRLGRIDDLNRVIQRNAACLLGENPDPLTEQTQRAAASA